MQSMELISSRSPRCVHTVALPRGTRYRQASKRFLIFTHIPKVNSFSAENSETQVIQAHRKVIQAPFYGSTFVLPIRHTGVSPSLEKIRLKTSRIGGLGAQATVNLKSHTITR